MRNSVHEMYGMSGFAEKLNVKNFEIQHEIVYNINERNVSICREIEYPVLLKLNGKLCTLNVWCVWIFK